MRLKSLLAPVIPARIREAREARGLNQEELGKIAGISAQAISQIERGLAAPKDSTLAAIMNELDFPLSFFTDERLADEQSIGPTFFRRRAKSQKKDIEMVAKRQTWLIRNIFPFLSTYIKFPAVNVPEYENGEPGQYTLKQIEEAAMNTRKAWGVGVGPMPDLAATMEINGIILSRISMGPQIDACSFWFKDRPFIMLANDKNNYFRSRFDEAHDLGHLVLHSRVDKKNGRIRDKDIEREADQFASALLMPGNSFGEEVFAATLDGLMQLKPRWGVSVAAMIHRCQDLGFISEYQASYLWKQRTMRGWRINEPLDDEYDVEIPVLFRRAIELILEEKIMTLEELISEFKLGVREVEVLCNILFQKYKTNPQNVLSIIRKTS